MDKLVSESYNYMYLITIDKDFLKDYSNIFSQRSKEQLQNIMLDENYGIKQNSNGILLKINRESRIIGSIEEE